MILRYLTEASSTQTELKDLESTVNVRLLSPLPVIFIHIFVGGAVYASVDYAKNAKLQTYNLYAQAMPFLQFNAKLLLIKLEWL